MSAAALSDLLTRLGSRITQAEGLVVNAPPALPLGWPELDAALPDGGFPRGVVELASPRAIGGVTAIALAAVRAAHAKDARAWCAWIDPEGTLYAPGIARAGVDLARLFVVRPPRGDVARIAVKVAGAGAFDVVVVDMDAVAGAERASGERGRKRRGGKAWPAEVLVRKLAILAEEHGATVVLLTDSRAARPVPWPVALRLEVARQPEALALRVAKERRGRVGVVKTVPLASRPLLGKAG